MENGYKIGVQEVFTEELALAYPPEEVKEADLEVASSTAETTFPMPFLREDDLRRMTRRFHLVPGGEVKPRLDCGSKGTATWAIETVGELKVEKEEKRAAAVKRRALEEKFIETLEQDSLYSPDPEFPMIKAWQRRPRLKNYRRVAPLNTQRGTLGWQTVRTTI